MEEGINLASDLPSLGPILQLHKGVQLLQFLILELLPRCKGPSGPHFTSHTQTQVFNLSIGVKFYMKQSVYLWHCLICGIFLPFPYMTLHQSFAIWNSNIFVSVLTWLCLISSAGAPYEFLYKVEIPVFWAAEREKEGKSRFTKHTSLASKWILKASLNTSYNACFPHTKVFQNICRLFLPLNGHHLCFGAHTCSWYTFINGSRLYIMLITILCTSYMNQQNNFIYS